MVDSLFWVCLCPPRFNKLDTIVSGDVMALTEMHIGQTDTNIFLGNSWFLHKL